MAEILEETSSSEYAIDHRLSRLRWKPVAVECIFTWYWLADLCAAEGMACVLGHALSMKAIHGGKAKNDKSDSHKIAGLLRGGLLPQASVYPAPLRATRDL